ncbi:MAG TPA: polysaccharide biosynthesis tyrosine autokinase [Burkholderiaceae bacterium]|nr:polysaccharide biosynthesis tyrosine autokinase [Burkholderiaceae bacterium]
MSFLKKSGNKASPNAPFFQSAFNELDESSPNSIFAHTEAPTTLSPDSIQTPRPAPDSPNRMGQAFIAANKLTEDEVVRIVQLQQRKRIRFGEAAIKLGLLNEEDVHEVLAQQFNYQTIAKHGDGGKKRISSRLLISHSPYSTQAEAIRRFRSEVMLRAGEQPCLVIALTSPNAKEGKSHLSASLAIAFAQLNLKTLLLDANLRKPSLHQLFDVTNKTGLSTMLVGRTLPTLDLSHAITNFLHVIPSGPKPPNPTEILSAPNLSDLLDKFKQDVKVIIIDTPPTRVGSDAQIIASQAGNVVLVCRKDQTTASNLRLAYETIDTASVRVLGTFFNNVPDVLDPTVGRIRQWLGRLGMPY